MFDPAYSQLLDTNQELRSELRDEISINKSNEKKLHSLVKELEQCYRTISLQDNTIIAHEKEIEKLKSEISNLRKQLRVLQQDKKFKDEVGSIQDGRIIELENKVERLKARIRILIDKKIPIDNLDMATTNLIANMVSEDTIWITLQNITTERDQYQNLLNDSIWRVQELLREKFAKQILCQRNVNLLQQNTRQLQTNTQNQGQILALQNNPLGNMADARRLPVLNLIAPILAKNKPYTGQEPSDDYLDRLIQSISFAQGHMTVLENANARDFDDAVKCVADGDAQTVRFLKNHLSGDFYTWMRAVAPASIDAFFTQLKDMWLKRAPNLNGAQNYQSNSSAEIDKLNSKIASLEAQLVQPIQAQSQNNDALEKMYIRAVRLEMPVDAPKDLTSLDNYINDELIRRLGIANTNYTKLSKKYSQMVNVVKKLAKHKCSNCDKAGHNSRKCPRKNKSKSKKGKVNLATLDSGSDSDTNSDMSSDSSSGSSSEFKSEADINKSKSHLMAKSQEVTDIETAPLVSAPISKKKKQSSESLSQDNQFRLENIIEKIIEKVLNEKFGATIAFFQSQNSASRILVNGKDDLTSNTPETPDSDGEDEILNEPMEIDFIQKKDPATDMMLLLLSVKSSI
ncbi:hypothetical protein C1645_832721 [Glomus cerebriforme]|uniref:CCHC-type domain-containing protein n=1 Tax=Glomus cerebriforme TaxID=658196 RepID=A0A397SHL7_9GLOM|nr:hypothetical protein C1645_832721 [Glomus cerebriforme]